MADSSGRGPIKPLYRVDGRITDQKPPKSENRKTEKVELSDEPGRYLVTFGPPLPAPVRPAFPRRPLDPKCLEPSDLSADQKAEVVRWVRKAQPDFDPETDPRGWISVAVKVRDVGYGEHEVRRMGYPQLEHVFRSLWPKMNRETTGSIFFAAETSTASIVRIDGAAVPEPEPRITEAEGDERQSRPKRKMRPEEQLFILYGRDQRVATLESRSLPAAVEAAFGKGESYTDRCYRDTELYRDWRGALADAAKKCGPGWMEGDMIEAGLEIYGNKPGRSDKRRTLDAKQDAAVRAFFRDADNATARAKARIADGG